MFEKGEVFRAGIDPGLGGAIAVLQESNWDIVFVYDMPITAGTGKRMRVNPAEVAKMLTGVDVVILEEVQPMKGQGVSSMFSFGRSLGMIEGVLAAMGIPYKMITPYSWKKAAGLIRRPKDYSRTMAQQLWPSAELGRVRDQGRADALLIARYGDIAK